jgi:hypothetical protein
VGLLFYYIIYKLTGKPEYVLAYIFGVFLVLINILLIANILSIFFSLLLIIIDIIVLSFIIHILFKKKKRIG